MNASFSALSCGAKWVDRTRVETFLVLVAQHILSNLCWMYAEDAMSDTLISTSKAPTVWRAVLQVA